MMLKLFPAVLLITGFLASADGVSTEKVYTPFFLQDKNDKQCLGLKGFTYCNENALWLLVDRPETKKYSLVPFINPSEGGICLEAVSKMFRTAKINMGSCASSGSKKWSYEFLNKDDIKLVSQGLSLARHGQYKNSMSLVPFDSGDYLPLFYYPTNIHEAGFYLKASSDGYCFDGNHFRLCDVAKEVLFGVNVAFSWRGKGARQFFNYKDKTSCLTISRNKVHLGELSVCTITDHASNMKQSAIGPDLCWYIYASASSMIGVELCFYCCYGCYFQGCAPTSLLSRGVCRTASSPTTTGRCVWCVQETTLRNWLHARLVLSTLGSRCQHFTRE